jgi:hypothetical protein
MLTGDEQVELRLLVPPPPKPPRPADAAISQPVHIDLSLEEAAVAREEAFLAAHARAIWPSDESIAEDIRKAEAEESRAKTVQGWVERGYDADDAAAAVELHGLDAAGSLQFLQACGKLRDEFGFEGALARSSMLTARGDVQEAIHGCLQANS